MERTKQIIVAALMVASGYLAVATLTFSIRHPWMTDMQIVMHIKSVLLFRRAEYQSKCLGCGTEFVSDKPSEDVAVCPNCPMTEEELDQLIEELKRDTVQ